LNNIDENELNKFNQLSDEWWNPNGPLKPLHQINPLRLAFIKQYADLAGKSVLDLGCGAGILTESLAQAGAQTTGLDMALDLINVARQHAKDSQLPNPPSYQVDTAENYAALYPEHFDIITCMEMLEHVPDPFSIIQALSTLLKPGGQLFCSTLNRTLQAYCQAIIGAEYILKLLPKGTHQYASFLRPSELISMARKTALKQKAIIGINYRLWNQTFYLSDNINVNYLIYFTKEKH